MDKKPVRILLDLDGVICDFSKKYAEIIGTTPSDVYATKDRTLKDKNWNAVVDAKIFENLEPMPGAAALISGLKNLITLRRIQVVEICTSAGGADRYDDVKPQKEKWLDENGFRGYTRHITVNGKAKADAMDDKYRDILVDDTPMIVQNFIDKGGIAILHTSTESTIQQLTQLV